MQLDLEDTLVTEQEKIEFWWERLNLDEVKLSSLLNGSEVRFSRQIGSLLEKLTPARKWFSEKISNLKPDFQASAQFFSKEEKEEIVDEVMQQEVRLSSLGFFKVLLIGMVFDVPARNPETKKFWKKEDLFSLVCHWETMTYQELTEKVLEKLAIRAAAEKQSQETLPPRFIRKGIDII